MSESTKKDNNDLPRLTKKRDPWQRCMDRLARLLALGTNYSPCIAVAFDQSSESFYMACNTPVVKVTKESKNEKDAYQEKYDQINELLLSKLAIIKKVITEEMSIEDALKELTQNGDHHHYGTQKTKEKRKYSDSIHRLRADLEKLKEFFDKNPGMRDSFLDATSAIFIPGLNAKSKSEHAEQVLATSENWENGAVIGVNYLCCATCDEEISTRSELQVRGTHGVRFPGVVRSVTKGPVGDMGSATLSVDLEASDSPSDSEMEKERKLEISKKKEKYQSVKLHLSNSSDGNRSTGLVASPSAFFSSSVSKGSEVSPRALTLLDELINSLALIVPGVPVINNDSNKENNPVIANQNNNQRRLKR